MIRRATLSVLTAIFCATVSVSAWAADTAAKEVAKEVQPEQPAAAAPAQAPAVVAAPPAVPAPAPARVLTSSEKLAKTAKEWRILAAKKKAAAEAEADPEKKKALLDGARQVEEIAGRTEKQGADELILEKSAPVLKARAEEKKAALALRAAQAALEKSRSEIQALGAPTDAATKTKAADFQKRMKDYQDKEAALAAIRQKRLSSEAEVLRKAASKKK